MKQNQVTYLQNTATFVALKNDEKILESVRKCDYSA